MSYIGRGIDQIDNISTLDNLSFNGSDATFNLTQNSVAFVPVSADALQIQIDGVIQSGNYTVSSSTVTFDFVPSSSSVCNGIRHFGVGLLTTVSDGAVTTAKLGADSVTNTKVASSVITNQTAITSLADTDKFLVSDASDSGNLKYVEKQYLPSGDWVKINTTQNYSSGTANLDISPFTTDYITYKMIGSVRAESGGVELRMRYLDGGTALTDSYYVYTADRHQIDTSGTTTHAINHSGFHTDHILLGNNLSANNNYGNVQFEFLCFDPMKVVNTYFHMHGFIRSRRDDNAMRGGTFTGHFNGNTTDTYEGIRFYMSSGNIEDYTITTYGLVK